MGCKENFTKLLVQRIPKCSQFVRYNHGNDRQKVKLTLAGRRRWENYVKLFRKV